MVPDRDHLADILREKIHQKGQRCALIKFGADAFNRAARAGGISLHGGDPDRSEVEARIVEHRALNLFECERRASLMKERQLPDFLACGEKVPFGLFREEPHRFIVSRQAFTLQPGAEPGGEGCDRHRVTADENRA